MEAIDLTAFSRLVKSQADPEPRPIDLVGVSTARNIISEFYTCSFILVENQRFLFLQVFMTSNNLGSYTGRLEEFQLSIFY